MKGAASGPRQSAYVFLASSRNRRNKKTLSAGNESFRDMIEYHRYYVDKTPYIKPLMESGSDQKVGIQYGQYYYIVRKLR